MVLGTQAKISVNSDWLSKAVLRINPHQGNPNVVRLEHS